MGQDTNSLAANDSIAVHKATMRRQVLELVTRSPRTCDEIEAALNMSHQTASARLTELYHACQIVRTGRRPTRSGRQAWVYDIAKGSV